MDRTDDKITLCKIKFNLGAYKHLTEDEIKYLSNTARNFFLFHSGFWNKIKTEKLSKYLDGRRQAARFRL